MLSLKDLTFRIGDRVLLDEASLQISEGHRVSIVGRNGVGKTTLLRLLAGDLTPDAGTIDLARGARIGRVAQEAPDGETTLIDAVLEADQERAHLMAEAETAHDSARIAEIHTRLADINAHNAPARGARILKGLGFDEAQQARPLSSYSGGWRMRVALAAMLFAEPDVLLLDEPTNHLDLESTIWLEGFLKRYPRTIILVSHDRDLLNAVPTTTVHLKDGVLTSYSGGWDQFVRQRTARQALADAERVKTEARRKHMQAFVDRFRYKASKARQAQSRIKMLERLELTGPVVSESVPDLKFPEPTPSLASPLFTTEKVDLGYEGKPVLRNLTLRIDADDRIALLGANGNGKSTFAKLLAARLSPLAGSIHRSPKMKVGYFAQHQTDELDVETTALAQASALMPGKTEEKVRSFLGRFGFTGDRSGTRIGDLSGGEKARLLLALMARELPHVLVLDEPTNHLDVESRDALVEAINEFPGAIILVTHDTHLIELTADRLWLVANGTIKQFDGDLADYRASLSGPKDSAFTQPTTPADVSPSRKDARRNAAEARDRIRPLRQEIKKLEKELSTLQKRQERLNAQMADPAFHEGPKDIVADVAKDLGLTEQQIEDVELAWFEKQEELEALSEELGIKP